VTGKLNARKAATVGQGKHADGGGLYLIVDAKGTGRWFYIFSWHGRRPEMGLGKRDDVPLAEARVAAEEARRLVRSGVNPIEARRVIATAPPTFGDVADALLEAKAPEWRNGKHRDQWIWSLKVAAAELRPLPINDIKTEHVLAVLKLIWQAKPETGARLRQRIEAVLNAAKAQGFRSGENPAAWRGHLAHLLPKRQRLAKAHHAAMPYAEVPAFMERLRALETVAAKALEFCILTGARSGEVYGCRWAEIEGSIWKIPPHRMKAGREHRVPLSNRALEIVEYLKPSRGHEFVFPGQRPGKPLSHIAMSKVMDRLGAKEATVHGFRSAFRDWAGNETHFAREVAEAALAHVVGDAAEQAYRRGDALDKRRDLMDAWARYCESESGSVLKFRTAV
jgi:integrase